MKEVSQQAGGRRCPEAGRGSGRSRACGSSTSAPASPRRSAPGCSARRAPRSSRSSSRAGRLHARDRPVRPAPTPSSEQAPTRCSGRSRAGPQERHARPAQARGPGRLPPAGATADVVVRELPPRHARALEHRPADLDPKLVIVRISSVRAGRPQRRSGRASTASASATAACCTSPGTPTGPPVRARRDHLRLPHRRLRRQAAVAALYAARTGRRRGRRDRRALYGSVLRILEWTIAGYDRSGSCAAGRATAWPTRRRSTTTPPPTAATSASSPAATPTSRRLCKAMDRPTCSTIRASPRSPTGPSTATRSTAIVAEWTSSLPATEVEERCVAHDVPVATAYTAADIFADPTWPARGDLVTVTSPSARTRGRRRGGGAALGPRHALGLDRGDRPPAGLLRPVPYGFGVIELTLERLRVVARLTESEPDRLDDSMEMALVPTCWARTTTAPRSSPGRSSRRA